jgi:hypothetical protein
MTDHLRRRFTLSAEFPESSEMSSGMLAESTDSITAFTLRFIRDRVGVSGGVASPALSDLAWGVSDGSGVGSP